MRLVVGITARSQAFSWPPALWASHSMKHKQTELKGKKGNSIIIVGHVNIAHSIMDRTTRQKNHQGNKRFKYHYNLINRSLKNIPLNNYRMHILLKYIKQVSINFKGGNPIKCALQPQWNENRTNRRKFGKFTNIWKLHVVINNQRVNGKLQ